MTRTPQEIVRTEIHYCASTLVSTLANAAGAIGAIDRNSMRCGTTNELEGLAEQAFELAAPIEDWEEPLLEAGWSYVDIGDGQLADWRWQHREDTGPGEPDARTACEEADIEPYEREVYEHWIVSDWLADQLEAHGEKVDRDFAGMTVWARTTTGQAIYADGVFETIAADLAREG